MSHLLLISFIVIIVVEKESNASSAAQKKKSKSAKKNTFYVRHHFYKSKKTFTSAYRMNQQLLFIYNQLYSSISSFFQEKYFHVDSIKNNVQMINSIKYDIIVFFILFSRTHIYMYIYRTLNTNKKENIILCFVFGWKMNTN